MMKKKHITYSADRRKTLKLMLLGSGAIIAPGFFTACGGGGGEAPQPAPITGFPQSVASGDPRADSIVLWTRVTDKEKPNEDLAVVLEVSQHDDCSDPFYTENLTAYNEFDHALKIKIEGLEPYTHYYYRFKYNDKENHYIYSNIGRTKTAPEEGSTENIKFAYISCQDYIGRYYNVLAHMLENQDDLDFIVHLGDYIYETNGEPMTQIISDKRQITFRDEEGAIHVNSYLAAGSMDNYRQLYQIYRSDEMLQRIHEKFPMIAIWDDHEFSDDNYGAHANYTGDKKDELNIERFHNSQRVYLEYMPLAVGLDASGVMSPDSTVLLDNENEVIIYRDFNFGSNLHLILSDYRSYRPDHLIPEDAFPATVFADKDSLELLGMYNDLETKDLLGAYIDVDTYDGGSFKPILKKIAKYMYEEEGLTSAEVTDRVDSAIQGNLNAYFSNEMIKAYNDGNAILPDDPLIYEDDSELENFDKGLAYLNGGKIDLFSSTGIGCRYMVIKDVFDAYIALKQGNIGSVYGAAQESWISTTLNSSSTAWRVYASSVSLAPMVVDFSDMTELDPLLRTQFYINLDQFDGFKYQRAQLISQLRDRPSVVISGDIHSTFVTDHHGVVEFTGSSVSSCTFSEALPRYIENSDISDHIPNIENIIENLDLSQLILDTNTALRSTNSSFPEIKTVDLNSNAYVVIEVQADNMKSTIYSIDAERSVENLYTIGNINTYFSSISYNIANSNMVLI